MEITTYKERYNTPTKTIPVPEAMQDKAFDVYFMPLAEEIQKPASKIATPEPEPNSITEKQLKNASDNSKLGFGDKLASYFADIPPPSCPEEELVIPERNHHTNRKPVDFE